MAVAAAHHVRDGGKRGRDEDAGDEDREEDRRDNPREERQSAQSAPPPPGRIEEDGVGARTFGFGVHRGGERNVAEAATSR